MNILMLQEASKVFDTSNIEEEFIVRRRNRNGSRINIMDSKATTFHYYIAFVDVQR